MQRELKELEALLTTVLSRTAEQISAHAGAPSIRVRTGSWSNQAGLLAGYVSLSPPDQMTSEYVEFVVDMSYHEHTLRCRADICRSSGEIVQEIDVLELPNARPEQLLPPIAHWLEKVAERAIPVMVRLIPS